MRQHYKLPTNFQQINVSNLLVGLLVVVAPPNESTTTPSSSSSSSSSCATRRRRGMTHRSCNVFLTRTDPLVIIGRFVPLLKTCAPKSLARLIPRCAPARAIVRARTPARRSRHRHRRRRHRRHRRASSPAGDSRRPWRARRARVRWRRRARAQTCAPPWWRAAAFAARARCAEGAMRCGGAVRTRGRARSARTRGRTALDWMMR